MLSGSPGRSKSLCVFQFNFSYRSCQESRSDRSGQMTTHLGRFTKNHCVKKNSHILGEINMKQIFEKTLLGCRGIRFPRGLCHLGMASL